MIQLKTIKNNLNFTLHSCSDKGTSIALRNIQLWGLGEYESIYNFNPFRDLD